MKKWPKFKSRIEFHSMLMPLEKVWFHLFFSQLWKNGANCIIYFSYGNLSWRRKSLNSNQLCSPLKLTLSQSAYGGRFICTKVQETQAISRNTAFKWGNRFLLPKSWFYITLWSWRQLSHLHLDEAIPIILVSYCLGMCSLIYVGLKVYYDICRKGLRDGGWHLSIFG